MGHERRSPGDLATTPTYLRTWTAWLFILHCCSKNSLHDFCKFYTNSNALLGGKPGYVAGAMRWLAQLSIKTGNTGEQLTLLKYNVVGGKVLLLVFFFYLWTELSIMLI